MAFTDLAKIQDCEGVGAKPRFRGESLFLAGIVGITESLVDRSSDGATAVSFFEDFLQVLSSYLTEFALRDVTELHIDEVYRAFYSHAFAERAKYSFLRAPIVDKAEQEPNGECTLVSFQPLSIFLYWAKNSLPDDSEIRLRLNDPSLTAIDIERIMDFIADRRNLLDDAKVGAPNRPLWVTLKRGRVAEIVSAIAENSVGKRQRAILAKELRDSLGLWKHRSTHSIAIETKFTFKEALKGPECELMPPTFFDSGGYERFRHWPTESRVDGGDREFGRTYELDSSIRTAMAPNDGLPELITHAMKLEKMVGPYYVGWCGDLGGDGDVATSHEDFSRDVSCDTDLTTAMNRLLNILEDAA